MRTLTYPLSATHPHGRASVRSSVFYLGCTCVVPADSLAVAIGACCKMQGLEKYLMTKLYDRWALAVMMGHNWIDPTKQPMQ